LVNIQTDPTDQNVWQKKLYAKIGKSQMRNIGQLSPEVVVDKITSMGHVLSILHAVNLINFMLQNYRIKILTMFQVEHPQTTHANAWKKIVSTQRKRAVVACFRMVALYGIPV